MVGRVLLACACGRARPMLMRARVGVRLRVARAGAGGDGADDIAPHGGGEPLQAHTRPLVIRPDLALTRPGAGPDLG